MPADILYTAPCTFPRTKRRSRMKKILSIVAVLSLLAAPALYAGRNAGEIHRVNDRLKALDEELDGAYGRWDELESLAAQ